MKTKPTNHRTVNRWKQMTHFGIVLLTLLPNTIFAAFAVNNAKQYRADTDAVIPYTTGTVPIGVGVYFDAAVTDTPGNTIKMEVELRKLPAAFTGAPTHSSGFVKSGTRAKTSAATVLPQVTTDGVTACVTARVSSATG